SPESGGAALSVQVIVPTRNGGPRWIEAAAAIAQARDHSRHVVRVCVVDTASSDGTDEVARKHGFEVTGIMPEQFDHGGTRNEAVDIQADIAVFLTQDAVLDTTDALDALVSAFADPKVAVAYGRQLPHVDANPIARHARMFNYPLVGRVCGREDGRRYGIKAVFSSNAFAAYRVSVFQELGGFPARLILSEDMYLAAKAALAGYRNAYVAEACARHSHDYSPIEEFRRYFDIGIFQSDQSWIADEFVGAVARESHGYGPREEVRRYVDIGRFQSGQAWIAVEFGGAGAEVKRFLVSEFRTLLRNAPRGLPRAAQHNGLKRLGDRRGKGY